MERQGEAIVLRTWPFHESDLIVSLLTREQGKLKGVARAALKSRRRFGGALEPMTLVRAHYVERPRQELVRLDSLEILRSPLSAPMDHSRLAGGAGATSGGSRVASRYVLCAVGDKADGLDARSV